MWQRFNQGTAEVSQGTAEVQQKYMYSMERFGGGMAK